MASRRVRMTTNCDYVQPMKMGLGRLVVTHNNKYNSILLDHYHKNEEKVGRLFAKFDGTNFDGVQMVFGLYKDFSALKCGSVSFNVYAVSLDGLFTETFIMTKSGTEQSSGLFTAQITSAELGAIELDGERTLLIKATATRARETIKEFKYFNHIGIYDNVFRLRQDVDFLDITKVDE